MDKIVGLGEVLWDIFHDGSVLGGAPGNFAIHANSLGYKGVVISAIGNDELGEKAKEIFKSRGLLTILPKVNYPTGTVVVDLDKEGKATYKFTKESAWDYLKMTKEMEKIASECSVVCFGSLGQCSRVSRDTIYSFLENTKDSCIRIFDINIREKYYSKEIIENSLNYATVLKLNDEELPLLVELFNLQTSENETLKYLKSRYGLDLIIVTKGSHGSLLYRSETDKSIIVPPKTEVVDTVGAGDSFTAVVAAGLLKGNDLEVINREANRVAAFVCKHKGATPDVSEVLKN